MTSPRKAKAVSGRQTPKAEEYAAQVKAELQEAWLPRIYSERIRKMRTRSYIFEGLTNKAQVEIQHTLLGVELKAGRRRLLCPDLATARYLSVFARVGCLQVAVPYDITRISQLADELESSWHRMFLLADHHTAGKSEAFRSRLRRLLVLMIKAEIGEAGAGSSVPEFRQNTKQRA
jgi:hypothetical protein